MYQVRYLLGNFIGRLIEDFVLSCVATLICTIYKAKAQN